MVRNGLVHAHVLTHPGLPASLEGLRIAHLTDIHINKSRGRHSRIIGHLARMPLDLVFFTGDYIWDERDEDVSFNVMQRIAAVLKPRIGSYGVFGNHDTHRLRELCASLPVRWLDNESVHLSSLPLDIFGTESDYCCPPDSVALLGGGSRDPVDVAEDVAIEGDGTGRLRIMLCHYPMYLPTASDLGMDLMFSGHTHGGQCRLPWGRALYNSSDLPLELTSGILRHRRTLCAVSRGLGEVGLPIRAWCPPHLPVYTLRRGPLPGRETAHIQNVHPW